MQSSFSSDLDAIIRKARRERAEEMHRLAKACIERIARVFRRAVPTPGQ